MTFILLLLFFFYHSPSDGFWSPSFSFPFRSPCHEKYKQYRNLLNNFIKSSKKSYYHNFFEKSNSDIKNIWKGIRSLVSLKPFGGTVPSKLLLVDIEVTDSKTIANAFNDFFSNIGPDISRLIPTVPNLPLTYMPNTLYDDLLLHQVSAEELSEIISKLNPSKSAGPFSILLKY